MSAGRKSRSAYTNDIPEKSATEGILKNQDQIITILAALMTKLDADLGVSDTDYSDLVATLEAIKLRQ